MELETTRDGWKIYKLSEEKCRELLKLAEEAMQFTYPHSNKGFAVTLLTDKGNIYPGASYGSDTYTLTMHSEAVALTNAAMEGERGIVAITGPNCHICKQLIWESAIRSKIDTLIIMEEQGEIKQIPISQLMTYPWPDRDGNIGI